MVVATSLMAQMKGIELQNPILDVTVKSDHSTMAILAIFWPFGPKILTWLKMFVETWLMALMKGIELQNSIPTVNAISNHRFVAILAIFGHFFCLKTLTLPKMVVETLLMALMKGIEL